jgi:hypothetical protein
MLPNIISIAEENGLIFNSKTMGKKEVLCKCPFCHEDANKRRFYLSLNTQDQVFNCWYCKASGGVFRFISLLSGVPESEVIQKHRKANGKQVYKAHPAEELTTAQLRLIGFHGKSNWFEIRKRDKDYFKRTLEYIWSEWQAYLDTQKRISFQILIMGIKTGIYTQAIRWIEEKSKEIGYSLLPDVLKVYGTDTRPAWAEDAHVLVEETYDSMPHRTVVAV